MGIHQWLCGMPFALGLASATISIFLMLYSMMREAKSNSKLLKPIACFLILAGGLMCLAITNGMLLSILGVPK